MPLPFRQARTAWVLAALAAPACGKVEPAEVPQGDRVTLSLYSGFDADMEKYGPVLQTYVDEATNWAADEDNDNRCYSWPDLPAKDPCSVDMCGHDPAGWPSVGSAKVMEIPVTEVERALLAPDWTEVFTSSFVEYQIEYETDANGDGSSADDLDRYLSGETHYFDRDYTAEVSAVLAHFTYFTRLQFRRIDNYDGQGNPAVLVRSWIPNGANTSNLDLQMNVSFNYEFLVPVDGGASTLRNFVSWGDASTEGGDPEDLASALCLGYRNGFKEIENWVEDNPS